MSEVKKYTLKPRENVFPNPELFNESNCKINYAEELNERQLEAVRTTEGPVLCIAGAGSGKTRTLIYRVAYLIEKGVPAENILLLTFTRKAAQEMLKRATNILDDRCRRIRGGTFHGFANTLLRRYATQANLSPNFSILDRSDAEDLVNYVRTEKGFAKNDTRFPKKNTLLEIFSKSVNTSLSIRNILEKDYPQFADLYNALEQLYDAYQICKRERAVLDYDDLLVELKLLLVLNKELCAKISREHKYIMVDEFQDTNSIQSEISYLLASEHSNILAVGDDAQSIYSFRGAEFRNIMDFPRKFPNCKIIALEQNYRSIEPILKFSNAILDNAREKYPKKLFSNNESTDKPVIIKPASVDEQANFICQRILDLREEGVELCEIAVLFRAAWHSNELEIELASRNIPFVKYGGIKFVEAAHVKDLICFLRVIRNYKDSVAWQRVLLLLEGVGTKGAEEITKLLALSEGSVSGLSGQSKKKYWNAVKSLVESISSIKEIEHPATCVKAVAELYFPLMKINYDDFTKRIDDINSLVQIATNYQSLESFMDDLALETPDQKQSGAEAVEKDDEKLILSTIHSSKGLEWHSVFVISLIDGFLPSTRSLGSDKEIDEERRLLYVACTRAKKNLYLLIPEHCRSRGYSPINPGFAFSEPSRFLGEIHNINELSETWVLEGEYDF